MLDKESILSLINVKGFIHKKGRKIQSLNSEINDPIDGKILMDKVIGIYLPDKDEHIGVLLDVEMQTINEKEERMYNRAEYYVSALMRSQKEVMFSNTNYEDMVKVKGLWFCLHEGSHAITSYNTEESVELGSHSIDKYIYDKRSIKFIYIGTKRGDERMEPLRILFNSELQPQEILKVLKDKYDIDLYNHEEDVNHMCEMHEYWSGRGRKKELRKEKEKEGWKV